MEKIESESESNRTTHMIAVSIPKSLIKRLNEYVSKQDIPPYKSSIFTKALEEFLEKRGN